MEPLQPKSVNATPVRRRQRLLLTVRVVVSPTQVSGLPFSEDRLTQVVNAHGALILMKQLVSAGDPLRLRHRETGQKVACTVFDVGERQDHRCDVGVEFDEPSTPSARNSGILMPVLFGVAVNSLLV